MCLLTEWERETHNTTELCRIINIPLILTFIMWTDNRQKLAEQSKFLASYSSLHYYLAVE